MKVGAYILEPSGQTGPDYWTYFAERLASLADPEPGASVLDIGTNDGNVLFKALARTGNGISIGIDIDPAGFQHGIRQARKKGWQNRVAFLQMDANALVSQRNASTASWRISSAGTELSIL